MSFFKKKSSSKRFQEGAIECSDFECVSFQDKPFTSKPPENPPPPVPAPYRFERNEVRQSFSEGMDPTRYAHPKSSIASVNNLGPNDRKLSESHIFQPENHSSLDHLAQLQRKRPGSARYSTRPPGQSANGHRHGSSSSLSSASSISSSSSFSNNHSASNGFQNELLQTINQSINQLSMMGEEEPSAINAPPKPKRPSTDRVKTTMAFYANKPTFGRDARGGLRQSSVEEEMGGEGGSGQLSAARNASPHASSTTINSNASNCSYHGQKVAICKDFIQGNKRALSELLKKLNGRQTLRDDLSMKCWSDYFVCSGRILLDQERKSLACYKVRCATANNLLLPQKIYLARIQCPSQQEAQQRICFENDYKICSSIPPHPNISTAYARFSDKIPENLPDFPYESTGATAFTESTFVISDFLSEGNLRTFVRENQHLMEHRVEEYEYQVCLLLLQLFRALHHLSENKVVHRDLKLENVTVGAADHPGGGKKLSLSNFGYALYQPDRAEPFLVTEDSNTWIGGNIHHLPPEIRHPVGDITGLDYTKSDVFGAGCMIYELLNLENPFESDEELVGRNYTQNDLPMIPKRSRYSYALDRLVCLLLRSKPSKRISAKRAGDLVEVMLWGPEELRGTDKAAAEQMAAEWLEQQRSEMLSNLALKLAENFTPQGARVQNSAGFSLEDELKCKFLRETSARALTTNLYLLSQCQRAQTRSGAMI